MYAARSICCAVLRFKRRWAADGVEVFEEIDRINDPYRLRLAYKQGVLEPLGRATFKVIPARYLQELGKGADDPDFAKAPFGSGPFKYEGRERRRDRTRVCRLAAESVLHAANRQARPALDPRMRMYVPSQSSLGKDVAAGQLHIIRTSPATSQLGSAATKGSRT